MVFGNGCHCLYGSASAVPYLPQTVLCMGSGFAWVEGEVEECMDDGGYGGGGKKSVVGVWSDNSVLRESTSMVQLDAFTHNRANRPAQSVPTKKHPWTQTCPHDRRPARTQPDLQPPHHPPTTTQTANLPPCSVSHHHEHHCQRCYQLHLHDPPAVRHHVDKPSRIHLPWSHPSLPTPLPHPLCHPTSPPPNVVLLWQYCKH